MTSISEPAPISLQARMTRFIFCSISASPRWTALKSSSATFSPCSIDDAAPQNSGRAAATASASEASEEAIVRGTLKLGANASARQLLAAFNALIESLKANPTLQLTILQRPFDIESAKSLKGGDITVEDSQPRSFSLQLSRKIGS